MFAAMSETLSIIPSTVLMVWRFDVYSTLNLVELPRVIIDSHRLPSPIPFKLDMLSTLFIWYLPFSFLFILFKHIFPGRYLHQFERQKQCFTDETRKDQQRWWLSFLASPQHSILFVLLLRSRRTYNVRSTIAFACLLRRRVHPCRFLKHLLP